MLDANLLTAEVPALCVNFLWFLAVPENYLASSLRFCWRVKRQFLLFVIHSQALPSRFLFQFCFLNCLNILDFAVLLVVSISQSVSQFLPPFLKSRFHKVHSVSILAASSAAFIFTAMRGISSPLNVLLSAWARSCFFTLSLDKLILDIICRPIWCNT